MARALEGFSLAFSVFHLILRDLIHIAGVVISCLGYIHFFLLFLLLVFFWFVFLLSALHDTHFFLTHTHINKEGSWLQLRFLSPIV